MNQGIGFHSGISLVLTGAWSSSEDLRILSKCLILFSNEVDVLEESVKCLMILLAIFGMFTGLIL